MLRKVASAGGAGLNGEGMGDNGEAVDVVDLMGCLPELFFGLGIVAAPYRRAFSGAAASLTMNAGSRSVLDLHRRPSSDLQKNTRAPNAPPKHRPNKPPP